MADPIGGSRLSDGGKLSLWYIEKSTPAAENKKYATVKVSQAAPLTYSGKVEAVRTQVLAPTSGKAQSVTVQNGDHVEQDQAVMTTFSESYEEQATEARQALAKAQRQVNQQQQAVEQAQRQLAQLSREDEGYTEMQTQVTTARNQLEDARGEVTDAQNKLNTLNGRVNGTVTAPFAGTVTVEYDKTGQPSVTLSSDDLQLSTQLSEYDYPKVKVGQELKVTALATKHEQTTNLGYLANTPAQNSKANDSKYELTAPLDGTKFMAGQTLNVMITQTGVQIPQSSVKAGHVYVVEAGKAKRVAVTGTKSNGSFIVKSGLNKGQRVIVDPDKGLKDGKTVETND
ncbi:efflux RND transporter periplasmic adaptor subunit [Ligilactobacillus animalis]